MDLEFDVTTIEDLPRPLTFRTYVALECYRRTKLVPRRFQVDFALAVDSGQDTVCVAGTGCGMSLAFALIHFFRTDVITWIVSPLNVIENQMSLVYVQYKLKAVAVNASTITEALIKDIKKGRYQVIISSPEAYKDSNKLHGALLSEDLAHYKHITIVDEAHTICTWGGSGFHKDFERIGDMCVFLPKDNVMCTATATLSETVRKGVIRSLHIKPDYSSINLGNWQRNLRYGVCVMKKGQNAYSEVCGFFNPSMPIQETSQAMIFVEDYLAAHLVADALRTQFGLSGQEASDLISVYHSLIDDPTKRRTEQHFKKGKARILITTEALTMRSGCGAHQEGLTCVCIVMVMRGQVSNAAKVCKSAGVEVDPVVLAMKTEEGDELEETHHVHKDSPETGNSKGSSRTMSLGMAEYIATGVAGGCMAEVIDRYFSNLPHISCLEVGGCENCDKWRQDQEPDAHREDHQTAREEGGGEETHKEELTHKAPKATNPDICPPAERGRFLDAILDWRKQKLREIFQVYDITLEEIMTKKESERIPKFKSITVPSDFDKPEVNWPGQPNWRLELLVILSDLQCTEDLQVVQAKEAVRIKAEEKALERQRAVEEKAKVKAEKEAKRKRNASMLSSGSRSHAVPALGLSTPAHGRTHINKGGIPSPITPATPNAPHIPNHVCSPNVPGSVQPVRRAFAQPCIAPPTPGPSPITQHTQAGPLSMVSVNAIVPGIVLT
ncbi:hypothetical protein FRC06_004159 [Ceratobasidium sp. 370]|nr:hypothetical protein FRC06_004159 [Ceratobasidium sp. 370]